MSMFGTIFKPAPQALQMAPPNGGSGPYRVGARAYTVSRGTLVDVPLEDVEALELQGWTRMTSAPPITPTREQLQARQAAAEKASWRNIPPGAPLARVIPPLTGPFASMTVEGRSYGSKGGGALDVPMEHARVLACNGWLLFGHSGTLESRPAQPRIGDIFVELPSDRVLQFDGRSWRDVHNGAVA